ncbi:MAG: hypothetical protein JNK37_02810 [Verrucomicrobiales bacterium]|nr:hypothetical protein [Verrucomicrobiales bacterium]
MTEISPSRQRALVILLRVLGGLSLSAIGAVFIPHAWMNAIHRTIGLGDLPDLPVVEYLSRSLSLFYAWLAIVPIYASLDVPRHLGLIRLFALSGLLVGVIQTIIDVTAPLPLWWTVAEGAFLFLYFGALWVLSRSSAGG